MSKNYKQGYWCRFCHDIASIRHTTPLWIVFYCGHSIKNPNPESVQPSRQLEMKL